ncbi:MAG: hypothetical protein DYG94_06460 [Leptolyngbya sp. PLA3]|nr:MAG: hypothetical protein EDM82_05740 [Cyanobacteria bacterium CYA]MCE7968372.1 hypothetical protein [Leptolyngbya sp. PL-A3]
MPSREFEHLEAVLGAAEQLLAAREDQMLTADEWDALQHAVAACREPDPTERDETFRVDADGCLVRAVAPRRGKPYEHRCPRDGFEAVADAAEQFGERGETFVLEDLRRATNIPWTQAAVAFAFLKERGIAIPAGGRAHAVAETGAFPDAMTEYHALREKPGE